jgi:hypothetical protein
MWSVVLFGVYTCWCVHTVHSHAPRCATPTPRDTVPSLILLSPPVVKSRPLTAVKNLYVCKEITPSIAPVLQELMSEHANSFRRSCYWISAMRAYEAQSIA